MRSAAAAIKDIVRSKQGIVLQIRTSKTDPNSAGTEVAIPKGRKPARCPVAMLDAWLAFAKIKEGPVFRPVQQNGKVWP